MSIEAILKNLLFSLVSGAVLYILTKCDLHLPEIWKRRKSSKIDVENAFWDKEKQENAAMYIPIYNRTQLEAVKGNVAGRYILMEDIDLSIGQDWKPIGDFISPFRGRFNGNGHIIKGAVGREEPIQGIFGYIGNEGVIYNLHVQDVDLKISGISGGIAADNSGTIVRCSVTGDIAGDVAGGLVGRNSGALIHCQTVCKVQGQDSAGGLTGSNEGLILACYTDECTVTAHKYAGGLIGESRFAGTVYGSYSAGVVAEGEIRAALVACNAGGIVSCYATAQGEAVFGLLGINEDYATVQAVVSPFAEGERWEEDAASGVDDGYCSLLGYEKRDDPEEDLYYDDLFVGVNLYSGMVNPPCSPYIIVSVDGITLENAPTVIADDEGVVRFVRDKYWTAGGIWNEVENGAPAIDWYYNGE